MALWRWAQCFRKAERGFLGLPTSRVPLTVVKWKPLPNHDVLVLVATQRATSSPPCHQQMLTNLIKSYAICDIYWRSLRYSFERCTTNRVSAAAPILSASRDWRADEWIKRPLWKARRSPPRHLMHRRYLAKTQTKARIKWRRGRQMHQRSEEYLLPKATAWFICTVRIHRCLPFNWAALMRCWCYAEGHFKQPSGKRGKL